MDGRDLEAADTLTIMVINVWNDIPLKRVVCTLEHGEEVAVLSAEWFGKDKRYHFEIQAGGCQGWVAEYFLSSEYHDPVGEEFRP